MSAVPEAIEGEWTMVFAIRDGQPLGADFVATGRRVLRDGETTMTFRGQVFMRGTTTVDTARTPWTIDYLLTGPPGRGKRQLGICELGDDGQLRICVAPPGRERPADFTTKPGDDRTLTGWRRSDAAGAAESR